MLSEESNLAPSQNDDRALVSTETTASPRTRRRWWLWLPIFCLIGIATYALLHFPHPGHQETTQGAKAADMPSASGQVTAPPADHAVPVDTAAVTQGNMGIYLTSLGTVTAFNTVTVHTRVDGQLVKVAFQEGQIVRQGDLLAEIDPRPFQVQLEQAEGQLAKDEAQLKNAKADLERYQALWAQDSIPKQQLDTQVALVQQDEGITQSDQAQIDNAKLQLVYSRITAPIAGRVGLRLVDPGNIVHAADQNGLVVITQLQPIAVIFNIAEDDLPQVLTKMRSGKPLTVDAYDRSVQDKLAPGTLLTIDNQIDPTTGTVKCKAVFPNEDNALFPNQFVNARLLVDTERDAVLMPTAAIQSSPQGTFVYAVKADSTVEMRNVVIGPTEGDQAVVTSGLSPGEVVVIEGADRLQQGMKVAARMADPRNTKRTE
jgi:multidrug efflux system membrane fusion protein